MPDHDPYARRIATAASGSLRPCPACRHGADEADRFCRRCGAELSTGSSPHNAPESGSVPSSPGRPVPDNGDPNLPRTQPPAPTPVPPAPLPAPPAPPELPALTCTHCGQGLPAAAIYCDQCGTECRQARAQYRVTRLTPTRCGESAVARGNEMTIGKAADCDLALANDDFLSRRHARISVSNGSLTLEDLGSSNGTYVRVRHPVAVDDGDEILIGSTLLRLERCATASAPKGGGA